MKVNLGRYCPKTFERAKGKKEKWCCQKFAVHSYATSRRRVMQLRTFNHHCMCMHMCSCEGIYVCVCKNVYIGTVVYICFTVFANLQCYVGTYITMV